MRPERAPPTRPSRCTIASINACNPSRSDTVAINNKPRSRPNSGHRRSPRSSRAAAMPAPPKVSPGWPNNAACLRPTRSAHRRPPGLRPRPSPSAAGRSSTRRRRRPLVWAGPAQPDDVEIRAAALPDMRVAAELRVRSIAKSRAAWLAGLTRRSGRSTGNRWASATVSRGRSGRTHSRLDLGEPASSIRTPR